MIDLYNDESYKGIARAAAVTVIQGGSVRLPAFPCRLVKLARWSVTNDEQFAVETAGDVLNSNREVYYGFDGVLFGQLFPGRETDYLPVNNTSQILIRCPLKVPDPVQVYFVWFE